MLNKTGTTKHSLTIFFFSLVLLYAIIFSFAYAITTEISTLVVILAYFWTFAGAEILTRRHQIRENGSNFFKTVALTIQAAFLGPITYFFSKKITT